MLSSQEIQSAPVSQYAQVRWLAPNEVVSLMNQTEIQETCLYCVVLHVHFYAFGCLLLAWMYQFTCIIINV